MSTYANAKALIAWIQQRPSVSVREIVASGMMESHTASNAVQYALRNGALERVGRSSPGAKERVRYRATGETLPTPRTRSMPSFDGLLTAWGIALAPPCLQSTASCRHLMHDF